MKKVRVNVAQISPLEWSIASKMQRVSFAPYTAHKRFILDLTENSELSDGGRHYLAHVAHRYRRQWRATPEETHWILEWKY